MSEPEKQPKKIDEEIGKLIQEVGKSLGSGIRNAIQLSKQKPPPPLTPLKTLRKPKRG